MKQDDFLILEAFFSDDYAGTVSVTLSLMKEGYISFSVENAMLAYLIATVWDKKETFVPVEERPLVYIRFFEEYLQRNKLEIEKAFDDLLRWFCFASCNDALGRIIEVYLKACICVSAFFNELGDSYYKDVLAKKGLLN